MSRRPLTSKNLGHTGIIAGRRESITTASHSLPGATTPSSPSPPTPEQEHARALLPDQAPRILAWQDAHLLFRGSGLTGTSPCSGETEHIGTASLSSCLFSPAQTPSLLSPLPPSRRNPFLFLPQWAHAQTTHTLPFRAPAANQHKRITMTERERAVRFGWRHDALSCASRSSRLRPVLQYKERPEIV